MFKFSDLFKDTEEKKKPKNLSAIKIDEISIVDKPANKLPFLFFKNESGEANSLTEIMSERNFTPEEIEELQTACVPLQKLSEDEAASVSILVLASASDEPTVSIDKDTLTIDTEDEDEKEVLEAALKVVVGMDTASLGAVHTLLKMDGEIKKALWPSLQSADNDDEPVNKNAGGLWPSLTGHVATATATVTKKSKALWPSISAR